MIFIVPSLLTSPTSRLMQDLRASLRSSQPEITNIVPPLGHSPQDLPPLQPAGTLSNFQLQSQHSDRAAAALPAMSWRFKNHTLDREAPGWGENVHLSLAGQHSSTSKPSALRAEESTGSYKLLINVE